MHRVADHGRRGAAHPRVVGRRTARQAAGPGMITGLGRERTLRHDEFAALAALSRRPVAELDTMPVSPGRFLAATGHDTARRLGHARHRRGGRARARQFGHSGEHGGEHGTGPVPTVGARRAHAGPRGPDRRAGRGRCGRAEPCGSCAGCWPGATPHSSPGSTARWRTTTPSSSSARSAPCPRSRRSRRRRGTHWTASSAARAPGRRRGSASLPEPPRASCTPPPCTPPSTGDPGSTTP